MKGKKKRRELTVALKDEQGMERLKTTRREGEGREEKLKRWNGRRERKRSGRNGWGSGKGKTGEKERTKMVRNGM